MIDAGADLKINPAFVASLSWDRRSYFNGPGDSILVITMHDGTVHKVRHTHTGSGWGGLDAYAIERRIVEAVQRDQSSDGTDRRDAARYRFLRNANSEHPTEGGIFIGITPANVIVTEEDADRAVDEAMTNGINGLSRIAATISASTADPIR